LLLLLFVVFFSSTAHTMQHWCIYFKWNQLLFREMYKAYLQGRLASHPGKVWYVSQPINGRAYQRKKQTNRCFVGMKASSAFLTITLFRWPKNCANAACLAFQVRIVCFSKTQSLTMRIILFLGDEYLNYAMKNREEWEQRGQIIVAETTEAVEKEFGEWRV
jgi:hypothetical protein